MKLNNFLFAACSSLKSGILLFLFSVLISNSAFSQSAPQLGKAPVNDVVKAMTLKEKVNLVVGRGWSPANMKVPGAAGQTHAIPRLGIPSMVLSDGPAGVRIKPIRNQNSSQTYYATAFPVARLLASTWDTSMVQKVGQAYGNEAHEYGVDIALMPALNIHRNPLNGRNFEYYSEDPVIAGKMAAAMVRGVQSEGVGTSIKHFVANNQEANRTGVNAIISERTLREIYLKGFEIAVKEAQPWTVMSSYNKVNGTYTAQRHDLLTTILRDEWGFKGFVMTDWGGGDDAVGQMKAGNDLIMPGSKKQIQQIIDAVKSGHLDEGVLDKNVKRILNIVLKTPAFKNYRYSNDPDLQAHAKIARKAAAEGMILLKNQSQTLPIHKKEQVALFGNRSYDLIVGGWGSGEVNEAYDVQLSQGLVDAEFSLDQQLKDDYQNYINNAEKSEDRHKLIPEMSVDPSQLQQTAKENDVGVITIGKNSGEGADRPKSGFYLNKKEKSLIKNVSSAFHAKGKKVIVVLNIPGVMDVTSWQNEVDGILLAWQPGQEAGHAIADVLSGNVNPSGHLATTFPVDYADVPSSDYFPGTPPKKPRHVTYKEGIFNGYRYYDTFNVSPAYEFGYGLSYTKFSFDKLDLSTSEFDQTETVNVNITNSGDVAGKEVVQLYISAPGKSKVKPSQELKAFAKTKRLEPGEKQTVSFRLGAADLASFNPQTSAWEADAGTYAVKIGTSSRDIRQTKSFQLSDKLTVEKVHNVLHPSKSVKEIAP